MSLHVWPTRFDFRDNETIKVTLTNTSSYPVMFKLQTNMPHIFMCRPTTGIVGPRSTMSINLLLKWWKLPDSTFFTCLFRLLTHVLPRIRAPVATLLRCYERYCEENFVEVLIDRRWKEDKRKNCRHSYIEETFCIDI